MLWCCTTSSAASFKPGHGDVEADMVVILEYPEEEVSGQKTQDQDSSEKMKRVSTMVAARKVLFDSAGNDADMSSEG